MRFISVLLVGIAFAVSACEDRAGKTRAGEEEEADRDGYALGAEDSEETADSGDSRPIIEGGDDEGTPDDEDGDSDDSPEEPEAPEEDFEDEGEDSEDSDDEESDPE